MGKRKLRRAILNQGKILCIRGNVLSLRLCSGTMTQSKTKKSDLSFYLKQLAFIYSGKVAA